MRFRILWCSLVVGLAAGTAAVPAAQTAYPADQVGLRDVLRIAVERRAEIAAARARARAAEARPEMVGALEDPMVSASIDHLPFMFEGADVSFAVEQRFPLSGIRGHRRAAARADVDRFRADVARAALDVRLEAAAAFLMLQERKRTFDLLQTQLASARDVVTAASARYAAATAPQSDVLIAEVEVARLMAQASSLAGEIRAAEAMLNASLALDPSTPVPSLASAPADAGAAWADSSAQLASRPELEAARAAVRRADAEIAVMKDMFRPMATVRAGPAYTMAEGNGLMVMVGVSIPLRRSALRAGVAEAEAMRAMASADLDAMTRMFEGEAAAARHGVDAARSRYAALRDDVLPRARAAIGPTLAGYAAGQLPLTSLLAAVQSVWQIEGDAIDAELRLGLAALRLGRALGSIEGAGR